MRVLHTHVEKYNIIWKEILYSQYLSALLAKKHYGNITFIGTPELVKQVTDIGIPYNVTLDDIVSLDDFDTWSVPKLKAFEAIKEPFLHIDNDTFIIDKIDFKKYKKPFLFSHPDMALKGFGSKYSSNITNLINSFETPDPDEKGNDFYFDINNTYLRLFFKLINTYPSHLFKTFDLKSIPNMNMVYVEDYKTFNSTASETLTHYYSNRHIIDKEEYGPCYIEQLMLHQLLRCNSEKYNHDSAKFNHTIFSGLPFSQKDPYNNVPSIDDVQFPFRGTLISNCECCNKKHTEDIIIESREDLVEFLEYDFKGFLHTTYLKWYDIFQAWTIHKLRNEIGDEGIRTVHNYFIKPYSRLKLPIKSGGEKLYEELTGFSFSKALY